MFNRTLLSCALLFAVGSAAFATPSLSVVGQATGGVVAKHGADDKGKDDRGGRGKPGDLSLA